MSKLLKIGFSLFLSLVFSLFFHTVSPLLQTKRTVVAIIAMRSRRGRQGFELDIDKTFGKIHGGSEQYMKQQMLKIHEAALLERERTRGLAKDLRFITMPKNMPSSSSVTTTTEREVKFARQISVRDAYDERRRTTELSRNLLFVEVKPGRCLRN